VVTRIDGGGQGDVFLCEHATYGRCALKVFVPEAKPRVEAEVAFLRTVDSRAIVELYASGDIQVRGEQTPYTIMEYVDGPPLQQRIAASHLLSETEARELVRMMANAIEQMWKNGKVHRDIKPDNILVDTNGRFILIDFGIVRHLDLPTMTVHGFAPGTPGYMSPEHDSAIRNLTYKADVFSLGVTTYEAMSGLHPFGRSQDAINQGLKPQDIKSVVSCSAGFAHLLMRTLDPRAVMRPELGDLQRG
jgi:serine/threonine-protein kinase